MQAESLVILTNVPGVLREFPDESSLIENVDTTGLAAVIELAEGRMKKKLLGASEALERGVERVIIADGRVASPVSRAFAGAGTVAGARIATPA